MAKNIVHKIDDHFINSWYYLNMNKFIELLETFDKNLTLEEVIPLLRDYKIEKVYLKKIIEQLSNHFEILCSRRDFYGVGLGNTDEEYFDLQESIYEYEWIHLNHPKGFNYNIQIQSPKKGTYIFYFREGWKKSLEERLCLFEEDPIRLKISNLNLKEFFELITDIDINQRIK